MNLLAIDTAANFCAVAVHDTAAGVVLAEASEAIGKGHAERLMGMVDAVLREAGVAVTDIGKIAVAIGPGSFTGIRVGVATARGLALALGVAAVGVTTLEALAAEAREAFPGRRLLAVIDARRGEIYAQAFGPDGRAEAEPRAMAAEAIAAEVAAAPDKPMLAGSGAGLVAAACGDNRPLEIAGTASTGSIAALARLAADREPGPPPVPLYLRAPDAKPQAGFAVERSGS